jgi:hypothetical protein
MGRHLPVLRRALASGGLLGVAAGVLTTPELLLAVKAGDDFTLVGLEMLNAYRTLAVIGGVALFACAVFLPAFLRRFGVRKLTAFGPIVLLGLAAAVSGGWGLGIQLMKT